MREKETLVQRLIVATRQEGKGWAQRWWASEERRRPKKQGGCQKSTSNGKTNYFGCREEKYMSQENIGIGMSYEGRR